MFGEILSLESLLAAWHRVRDNQGCAGVDGVTIEDFESGLHFEMGRLREELAKGTYRPLPLLRILVEKGEGEARALCVPAVRDRVAQAAALSVIEPILEAQFEECSFAYRRGRSVRQAVYRIKELRDQGYQWVVAADIDAFFDSVDHELVQAKIRHFIPDGRIRGLLELWIKAELWDGEAVTRLSRGLPQGSVVSPILANLFDRTDAAGGNDGARQPGRGGESDFAGGVSEICWDCQRLSRGDSLLPAVSAGLGLPSQARG